MNFKMFLEFPGILILVGIVLLLISIIISIIAYGSKEKNKKIEETNNDDNANALGNIEYETNNNYVVNTQNKDINENYNFFNTSTQAIYNDANANALGMSITNNVENVQTNTNMQQDNNISYNMNNTAEPELINNNININEVNNIETNSSIEQVEQNNVNIPISNPNEEAIVSDLSNTMIMPTIEDQASKLDLNTGTIEKMNLFTETPNVPEQKEVINEVLINNTVNEYKAPDFSVPNIEPVINNIETPNIQKQEEVKQQEPDIPSFDFDFEEKAEENDQKSEETIDSILEKTRIESAPIINEQALNDIIEKEEPKVEEIPEFKEVQEVPKPIETYVEKVEENKRPIYGGTSPLENITLNFQEEKKEAYSNKNYKPNEVIKTTETSDDLELL